jgi:hypothetical protein
MRRVVVPKEVLSPRGTKTNCETVVAVAASFAAGELALFWAIAEIATATVRKHINFKIRVAKTCMSDLPHFWKGEFDSGDAAAAARDGLNWAAQII